MLSPIDVVAYPDGKVAYEAQATSINVICENTSEYSKSVKWRRQNSLYPLIHLLHLALLQKTVKKYS